MPAAQSTMRVKHLLMRTTGPVEPVQLRRHVLTDALRTTSAATVVGVLGALGVGRVLAGLLVGTSAHDPVSLAGAAAVALCAGGIGCVLAARGAARITPADALRD